MSAHLVQRAADVDRLLADGDADPAWIALTPDAMNELDRRRIRYAIPEDFCPAAAIERACDDQFAALSRICGELDAEMAAADPFLRDLGIQPFAFHLTSLASLLDTAVSTATFLDRIFNGTAGAAVYVDHGHAGDCPRFGDDLRLAPHQSAWGRVLALPDWGEARRRSITCGSALAGPVGPPEGGPHYSDIGGIARAALSETPRFRSALQGVRHHLPRSVARALLPRVPKNRSVVLALASLSEWRHLLPFFAQSGCDLLFWSSDPPQRGAIALDGRAVAECFLNRWSAANADLPVDLRPMFADRVRWIAGASAARAQTIVGQLERLTGAARICLAVNGEAPAFSVHVANRWCRARGLPVVGWQHGAVWQEGRRITERIDLHDLLTSTTCLAFGEGSRRAYQSTSLPRPAAVVPIGSIALDSLRTQSRDPRTPRRILWVVDAYWGSQWDAGFSPPPSDRLYFRAQVVIAERLNALAAAGARITIKLHPSARAAGGYPPWAARVSRNPGIQLVDRGPRFAELLADHDAVIVDSPTTTLLEAIATPLPVFVLTSCVSPPSADLGSLRRRAVCHAPAESLMDDVAGWYRDGAYVADVHDREFLRAYGTYRDDGRSLERLQQIVRPFLEPSGLAP